MGGLRRLSRLELVVMTLLQAAVNGDVVEVRRLVATGVNVDERDANGATALLLAAEHGKVEVIRALVELGCVLSGHRRLCAAGGSAHCDAAVADASGASNPVCPPASAH